MGSADGLIFTSCMEGVLMSPPSSFYSQGIPANWQQAGLLRCMGNIQEINVC